MYILWFEVLVRAKLQKWGNSLGIRIPKSIANEVKIGDGDSVELKVTNGKVVIQPVPEEETLESLLSEVTDSNIHTEQEIGTPKGKEIW